MQSSVSYRRRTRVHGETFFGVMIATVIISLAVIPMATALIEQTRQTRYSESRVFATQLAQNIIERVKLEPYDYLASLCGSLEEGRLFIAQDPLLAPPADAPPAYLNMLAHFGRTVVFVEVAPRVATIEAIVDWTEDGRYREIRLKTMVVDTFMPGGRP